MTSALVIALSLAGFGLLVFGERMGLGPQLAAYGVLAIFAMATVALALASMSARLARFVVGRERSSTLGLAALVAILVFFGLMAQPPGARMWLQGLGLIAGLVLAFVAAPRAIWRNFVADLALHGDRDPGDGTRGALPVLMVCAVLLCLLMLVDHMPAVLNQLVAVTGVSHLRVFVTVLGLSGFVVVLGGLFGLQRIAKALVVIAVVAAVLPAGLLLAGQFFDRFDIEAVRQAEASVAGALTVRVNIDLFREMWPAIALGFGFGLALNQPAIAVRHRFLRGAGLFSGVMLALLLALLTQTGQAILKATVSESLLAVPPVQWPLFVFDETLRGWVRVCGALPDDAMTLARACGQTTARAPLDATRFVFSPGLDAPALALSLGLPVILGFIWGLLVPLFQVVALAFLLHAAASGFAERVLFRTLHPKALRSGRLGMVRLSLIALLAMLYLADRYALRLDPNLLRWAMTGLTGTALVAIFAFRLLQGMRAFRAWRQRRGLTKPPAETSLPPAGPEPATA